jgi:two-component system NarL family sensor kinase
MGTDIELTESQRFLKRMIVSTINAREVELNRVSRLLHDEVGQVLSAVGLQMGVLKLDFKDRLPEIIERIHEIQHMLDHAVQQVRALSYDLNPAVVERVGLQFALDRLVGRFRTEFPGAVRFLFDSSVRVPLDIANAWYKIAELAMENTVKHANATKIELHVKSTPKATIMEIRDNGSGFSIVEAKLKPAGLGLLLIEHYATQAPISIDIKTTPGKGTVVRSSYSGEGERAPLTDKLTRK